ncbi:MAG: type II toxin-antitoxin system VapC family toxin [Thermodesulfobacteriota bacterium]
MRELLERLLQRTPVVPDVPPVEAVREEVAQVLRRYSVSGAMEPERGLEALIDLADLPITRYPHDIFLPRIWELRHNMTAYDAVYVTLAETLSASLLTRDTRLASASGHEATIVLL